MDDKRRLVGVPLCPYVQRVAIVLQEKGLAYAAQEIDLKWPPAWFLEYSPLVKVPVLIEGERALFESRVICEYLDTLAPPSLQAPTAWQRAQERAYSALADELLAHQYVAMKSSDDDAREAAQAAQRRLLRHLEARVVGPYFSGAHYRLVDAAYAPYAQRLCLLEAWRHHDEDLCAGLARVSHWLHTLSERPSTTAAAGEDFAPRLQRFLGTQGGLKKA